jgi:soluble lytic murein transglycosylase-like protein
MRRFALATLLAFASPAFARAQPRMWLDKEGTLHVDDRPPARSSARKAAPARPAEPQRWWERRSDAPPDQIDHAAQLYNIPAELVRAVIAVESAGDAGAISHKGALGLMQLMPGTAGQMYVVDPVDPAQNIFGGTRYLRYLANQFGGDMMLVLAAYNAGPDAVRKYKGVPPFEETRLYVRKVMSHYYELKRESRKQKLAQAERAK